MSQRSSVSTALVGVVVFSVLLLFGDERPPFPLASAHDPKIMGNDASSFGQTKVWSIHIELSASEFDAMQPALGGGFGPPPPQVGKKRESERNLFNTEFPWAEAAFTVEGTTLKKVGVRYSGDITYLVAARGLKRPMKVAFDRFGGQPFNGLAAVQLHAMPLDPLTAREALAYAVFRTAGVHAPRTAYAEVTLTVRGKYDREYLGLFTVVEDVDARFLADHFGSDRGLAMKPFGVRGIDFLGDDWDRYKGQYRPQREATKDEGKRVVEFAKLVNQSTDEEFRKQIKSFLDVDAFLRFMAANALTSNLESFFALGHNYTLYLDPKTNHKRMMELLNITSLRRGADGNPKSVNAANLDESKANPFPDLPNPLVFKNGKKVATAEEWRQRRVEIVEDFDREVYGRVPKETPKVQWEVKETNKEKVGEIAVITKRLIGHVDNAAYPLVSVDVQLTLTTPENAGGPVPVVMEFGFNFGGRGPTGQPAGRGGPNWQQQLLAKGWGFAILSPNSIQADNGAGLTTGIIGLCNKGQPRRPDDWGALRAWAWGASRALDYLETDKAVDAKQVGIEGLSRYGKAAIVTMAYDERFAIGFIGSSGAGGVKLHRRDYGEKVENVAGSGEYHWMAGNYLKYAGPLTAKDLPVDAHELVALCAPRPVFISVGSLQVEGGWVDARGMFMAGVGAEPVYQLLGKKGLGTAEFPAQETGLDDGEIAFRQHAGGHTTGPNWPTFLKFADRYLKGPPSPAPKPPTTDK